MVTQLATSTDQRECVVLFHLGHFCPMALFPLIFKELIGIADDNMGYFCLKFLRFSSETTRITHKQGWS